MPIYFYKAKTETGKIKTGYEEVDNEDSLVRLLQEKKLVLIEAHPLIKKEKSNIRFWGNFFGISLVEKMMFCRHLAVMIKAGVSLTEGLEILSRQTRSAKFGRIIREIAEKVREGKSFSQALSQYPDVFDNLFVSMIQVGEVSGNLEKVLRILADQMKKDYQLRSKVKGAMVYPAVILAAMIGIGFLMMVKVIPKITSVFLELKIELPLTTRLVIKISQFLQKYSLVVLLLFIGLIFLIRFLIKIKSVKRVLDYVFISLPLLGPIIKKINIARFARNLSSLIEGGVEIVQALRIVAQTMGNSCFQEVLIKAGQEIQKGKSLSKFFQFYTNLFPLMVIQMIKVGEETGTLSYTLVTLADFYEEEVTNITKNLSSIIEPVLMIIIGAAVGFFAVSMIQPMYSMMGAI